MESSVCSATTVTTTISYEFKTLRAQAADLSMEKTNSKYRDSVREIAGQ